MAMYCIPVNLTKWNVLEEIKEPGVEIKCPASKEMQIGDIVVFFIRHQARGKESGIYGYGEIISETYTNLDDVGNFMENKLVVNIKVVKSAYLFPFIAAEDCKSYIDSRKRTASMISPEYKDEILMPMNQEYTYDRMMRSILCRYEYTTGYSYIIDKGLYPLLTELNEKKWYTEYSCEGHVNPVNIRWVSYLMFAHQYQFPIPIPVFDTSKSATSRVAPYTRIKITNYWRQKDKPDAPHAYYWFGSKSKKMNLINQEEERKAWLDAMIEWAKKLPVNDGQWIE